MTTLSDGKPDPYLTDPKLIRGIKEDGNDAAWQRFYETYRRFIWTIAMNYNVRDADRDGLVNEILAELYRTRERFQYEPDKGKFRNYLRTMVQHYILRSRRKEHPAEDIDSPDAKPLADESEFSRIWDEEWKKYVIERAFELLAKKMDPVSYQVFRSVTVGNEKPDDVARRFNIKRGNVDTIKFTGMNLLKAFRNALGDE